MPEFMVLSLGIAATMATLLFLLKLFQDRSAAHRGVAGALSAPRRSWWISVIGFLVALVVFPFGAALSLNIGPLELYRLWDLDLLTKDEGRWFIVCFFGSAALTLVFFFTAHIPRHRKHLPWYGRKES